MKLSVDSSLDYANIDPESRRYTCMELVSGQMATGLHVVPKEASTMANVTNKTNRTRAEEDLAQALHRIHQVYGSDLNAFFSDVQRRLGIERSAKSDMDTHVKPRLKRR
jgi:hypothetical protein